MPAPFPKPCSGKFLRAPSGFPLIEKRNPRIVTADPWAFLRHLATALPHPNDRTALAYIDQAFDFFEAAANPHQGSKPLLYYYSFLNVVKSALLIRKVKIPLTVRHGISDPRANEKKRLRLEGQMVRIEKLASDHSQLFPEFVNAIGGDASRQFTLKIIRLLAQIPSIHRTYTRVTGDAPNFLPIKRTELLYGRSNVWARIIFEPKDKDVSSTLPLLRRERGFAKFAHQVACVGPDEIWFETIQIPGQRRGVDPAIQKLSRLFRSFGVSNILTSRGYRFYFCTVPPRERLPQLAAAYAIIFYLGSITRYKPDVFDKIISGGYAWIVEEFLATIPMQFLYSLASELAGVDVVRPFSVVE